jgi:hypothetical protein
LSIVEAAKCRIFKFRYAELPYAECHYDGCHYAGCHGVPILSRAENLLETLIEQNTENFKKLLKYKNAFLFKDM